MNRNSMNQKKWNEGKIDDRTAADIEGRIESLAASYVPEWHFNREDPDIGAVIGRIFARQTEGNISRCNQVLERYRTEFVNMLGISLLPAKPAEGTVIMGLLQDTIPGVEVYRGTKLLAGTDGEEGEQTVFETSHDLYVTNSTIEYVFMTESAGGKIIPLKGHFDAPAAARGPEAENGEEEEEAIPQAEPGEAEESAAPLTPFRLYDSGMDGIQLNALLIYHENALDVTDDSIYVRFPEAGEIVQRIRDGEFKFYYDTRQGLLPVEHVQVCPDGLTVELKKEQENRKTMIREIPYSLLVLKAEKPVREAVTLKGILLSSSGKEVPADFVNNGDTDFDVESFDPFGDTLSLFQECYIGHDSYFGKAGAMVTLRFDVSYPEHRMISGGPEEDVSLKVIKRKPRTMLNTTVAESRAEEISFEYYNGIGWKRLNCVQEVRRLFADDRKGTYEISFQCPSDWQAAGAGAYEGRCIRMQLQKADDCYMRPGIHHYPHVENLRLSFSYEGHYTPPQRLEAVMGTRKLDLTRQILEQQPFTAFSGSGYNGDALYLGFNRKLESGPVSILFQMEEGIRFEGVRCRFEYSTAKGFRQMKVLDYTSDMSRSGIVMFVPQADMHAVTLEGKTACWLRVSRIGDGDLPVRSALPLIKDIRPNAVRVVNVETREEEDFYLEETSPNMTVRLGVPHILDTELWMNETGSLTRPQMRRMLEDMPQSVRAEYDMLGEISSFFVKWEEADQLDEAPSPRSYMLDRLSGTLVFGDGMRTMLPTVVDDVTFRVRIRCCSGEKGNVPAGAVSEPLGVLPFVETIYNPVRTYGGSSIEDLDGALLRGANILKSRHRLVSEDDYLQEILSYSDVIDRASCVTGETISGQRQDGAVTFVILLKDFESGSYSFHTVAGALKRHLLENCELTIAPEDLNIVEPFFARISVDVWVEVPEMDDSFEIQNLLQSTLEHYLNPLEGFGGPGWEIGKLPKRSQLLMKLNVLKSKAVIRKMVVTVRYTDQNGEHETDLEDMKENPFLICCSGKHRVNILLSEK